MILIALCLFSIVANPPAVANRSQKITNIQQEMERARPELCKTPGIIEIGAGVAEIHPFGIFMILGRKSSMDVLYHRQSGGSRQPTQQISKIVLEMERARPELYKTSSIIEIGARVAEIHPFQKIMILGRKVEIFDENQ